MGPKLPATPSNIDDQTKRKIRRIVFGTMLAGGALGIAGVTAQAHGNASSHKSLSLDWNFDNFVINRETQLNPAVSSNDPIVMLDRELREARLEQALGGIEFGDSSTNARMTKLSQNKVISDRVSGLEFSLKQISTQRALTPLSMSVLAQLRANNIPGAIMLIERSGTAEQVLDAYATVQVDLYNYSAVNDRSTTALTNEIGEICNAAISYQSRNAPDDLVALGGFLHNLASAAMPDVGEPTPEQFQMGRAAALRAVDVRRSTNNPETIGIALYMAGVYSYKAAEYDDAEQQFKESISLLENTSRLNDLAWSKAFLGFTELASGNDSGRVLVEEAKQIFQRGGNVYGIDYISSYMP